MQSYKGRFDPTRFEDLTVTVDFHCQSACRFCIVQEGMNFYKGVPFDVYERAVEDNRRTRRYRRITFTGGEVTLERKLFDYVTVASASQSFEHIRVQTNGRRLADRSYAKALIGAGVDELFVSLHGHDAATQDFISQRPGSFDEAMRGISNVVELGATLITNTVLTTLNQAHLADIVETVRPFRPARMEWWNYLPMEDYADERDLIAPMSTLAPRLRDALASCRRHGIDAAVKYVPRCLLGEHERTQDNTQADVVIVEEFYDKYPKFACLYEAKCEHGESCLGLHHAYITKHGWERDALTPHPRTTPWEEPEYGPWVGSEQSAGGHAPAIDQPRWAALVAGVDGETGAALTEIVVQRRACVYRFAHGASSVDIVLTARDGDAPALARSKSFNLHYRNARGDDHATLTKIVHAAARAIVARDPGNMMLDLRKGMVGPGSVRGRGSRREG
ncbi:radical SAM protein [Sandaracinus amylolyticus]|uniref:Radical SAM domain protein n=1 Tax=Sandaracinus amylolyticus TaxID=927083 RepID=A0A0F6VYY7_9BACT|nr:radical SAM protein [Sandaracinus amylolyticus]AKF03212.1 radical SAM domain protein [Sandaracinus amylolyticus]